MNRQIKIKVIKKNAARTYKTTVTAKEIPNRQATREMVSTVSDWVNEFQQRRRIETRQALNLWNADIENSRQTSQSV